MTFTHLGTQQDKDYFYINPTTGEVNLKKSLETTGTPSSFNVSMALLI